MHDLEARLSEKKYSSKRAKLPSPMLDNHYAQEPRANPIPFLYIDINITPTRQERIQVYEGDTPFDLADEFC